MKNPLLLWSRLFSVGALSLAFSCSSSLKISDNYKIVIPNNADSLTMHAANELQSYFQKINGSQLAVISDTEKTAGPEILVGITNRTDTTSYNIAGLKGDGFHIYTIEDNIQILGGSNKGALYGVYTLLDEYLGCRLYSATAEVIPTANEIELPAVIDNRQVPVITFRDIHYRETNNQKYIDWHRLNHDEKGGKPEWGLWVHTYERLLPAREHFAKHPEYYALIGGKRATTQPCLTNPAVLEIICENLAKDIAKNPNALYWSVSSNDNFGYCQCPKCAQADALDGSATGSVIQFTNKVAARFPDKIISTLAYQYSRAAPKVTKPAPNVNIMFCNIECNRSKPIAIDPSSESFRKDMENWAKLTDNIVVWDYVIQFKNLVSPFPNFHTLQPNLKYFVDNNVVAMFEQGNREVGGEFCDLRSYVLSKLAWNPDANTDSLITDFCNGYYGAGGRFVKEYIDTLTAELIKSDASMGIFGSPCNAANSYLSAKNMANYNAMFDRAQQAVQNDSAFLKRVQIARQPLKYAFLEITKLDPYGPNGVYIKDANDKWTTNPVYIQTLNDFIALCKEQGVTRLSEWHTTPDEYLKMMSEVSVIRTEGPSFNAAVTITPAPHKKYAVNADKLLTNGIHGTNDYTIQWLGWDTPSFELVMDMGDNKMFNEISVRFQQNLSDWIFWPVQVDYFVSTDGTTYQNAGSVKNAIEPQVSVATKNYTAKTANLSARYVKAVITTVGTCPHWHLGAGGKAFCFADEFSVN